VLRLRVDQALGGRGSPQPALRLKELNSCGWALHAVSWRTARELEVIRVCDALLDMSKEQIKSDCGCPGMISRALQKKSNIHLSNLTSSIRCIETFEAGWDPKVLIISVVE